MPNKGKVHLSLGPKATPESVLDTLVAVKHELDPTLAKDLQSMSDLEFREFLIESNDYFKS